MTGGKRKAGGEGLRIGGRKGKTSTSTSASYGSILPTSIEGSDEGNYYKFILLL